jgi:hypothetical protein
MKYFLDTEFHEYKKKPLIGKSIDTIELISIGIVGEGTKFVGSVDPFSDNEEVNVTKYTVLKEYYAISKDFDLKAAWGQLSNRRTNST